MIHPNLYFKFEAGKLHRILDANYLVDNGTHQDERFDCVHPRCKAMQRVVREREQISPNGGAGVLWDVRRLEH